MLGMTVLIGLGNPGQQYEKTRHNAGWLVVDALLAAHPEGWKHSSRKDWGAELWVKPNVVIVKPQTYMNDSGRATQAVSQFYKVEPKHIFVIHDDLDIPLGSYKIQLGTGPKVHNGLVSIQQTLGTEEFWHVRVGVDNRQGDRTLPGSAYVLQQFSAPEWDIFQQVVEKLLPDLWGRLS